MSRRRMICLAVAGVLSLTAAIWLLAGVEPAPRYDGRTAGEWVQRLVDPDYRQRAEAEAALLGLGPDAFPALVRGLNRQEIPFRDRLLPLLQRFGWARSGLPEAAAVRAASARLLGLFGSRSAPAAPRLVGALRDPQPDVLQEAARSLRRIGTPAVAALLEGLDDRDPRIRACSAEVLGDFAGNADSATPSLLRRLEQDREASVRSSAARALGRVAPDDPGVSTAIAARLDDPDPAVRAAAAEALGHCGAAAHSFRPALTTRLEDRHVSVQMEACRALWRLGAGPDAVVPTLTRLLADREAGWQAAFLLGEIGPPARVAIPELVRALQRETVPRPLRSPPSSAIALGKIGAASIPGLRPLLADPQPSIRVGAVLALGMIGPSARETAPALFELVQDRDAEVRTAAALALGSIDAANQRLVPLLKVLSREDDILISSSAVSLLRKLDPAAASEVGPE